MTEMGRAALGETARKKAPHGGTPRAAAGPVPGWRAANSCALDEDTRARRSERNVRVQLLRRFKCVTALPLRGRAPPDELTGAVRLRASARLLPGPRANASWRSRSSRAEGPFERRSHCPDRPRGVGSLLKITCRHLPGDLSQASQLAGALFARRQQRKNVSPISQARNVIPFLFPFLTSLSNFIQLDCASSAIAG
jgi:hypothetical protein